MAYITSKTDNTKLYRLEGNVLRYKIDETEGKIELNMKTRFEDAKMLESLRGEKITLQTDKMEKGIDFNRESVGNFGIFDLYAITGDLIGPCVDFVEYLD